MIASLYQSGSRSRFWTPVGTSRAASTPTRCTVPRAALVERSGGALPGRWGRPHRLPGRAFPEQAGERSLLLVEKAWRPAGCAPRAVAAASIALLAACDPWHCDFESHGACIEFTTPPADLAATQARVDALLDRELPFWGLTRVKGWRIQFRDSVNRQCYFSAESEGCTDYVDNTISVHIPPSSDGCFEASELLHELGHYQLGDPMHSNDAWRGVEPAFARMVWDFPDAPAPCVARYRGITSGMWPVNLNNF